MRRDQAILYLLKNNIFNVVDEGSPAMEFYIRDMVDHNASILDIDCHAHLNTLFGYDIGFTKAMAVTNWLWDPEKNGTGSGIDVMDITHDRKDILMQCNEESGLGLSFGDWKETPMDGYEYF